MQIIWSEEFSVGVKLIDDQHKHFIEILNNLNECIDNAQEEKLEGILTELVNYKNFHFQTEERYFDEFQFDGAKEHKKKHQELSDKVQAFIDREDEPKIQIALDLQDFLDDWLLNHLADVDKKYTKCFNEHGLT